MGQKLQLSFGFGFVSGTRVFQEGLKYVFVVLWISGACEGTLACSTCHVIFDEDVYKTLGRVTDEEMDMLDLAYGLTDT